MGGKEWRKDPGHLKRASVEGSHKTGHDGGKKKKKPGGRNRIVPVLAAKRQVRITRRNDKRDGGSGFFFWNKKTGDRVKKSIKTGMKEERS